MTAFYLRTICRLHVNIALGRKTCLLWKEICLFFIKIVDFFSLKNGSCSRNSKSCVVFNQWLKDKSIYQHQNFLSKRHFLKRLSKSMVFFLFPWISICISQFIYFFTSPDTFHWRRWHHSKWYAQYPFVVDPYYTNNPGSWVLKCTVLCHSCPSLRRFLARIAWWSNSRMASPNLYSHQWLLLLRSCAWGHGC